MLKKWKQKKFEDLYYRLFGKFLADPAFISYLYNELDKERAKREKEKYDERARALAKRLLDALEKKQASCSHLKGSMGIRSVTKDFNVSIHTFPDNTRRVRCLTCGKVWTGEQLKSEEVQHMLANTTNTPTASEVPITEGKKTGKPISFEVSFQEYQDFKKAEEREDENRKNNPAWPWMGKKRWEWLHRAYAPFAAQKKLDKQKELK